MTCRQRDQVNHILDASWYRKSSPKIKAEKFKFSPFHFSKTDGLNSNHRVAMSLKSYPFKRVKFRRNTEINFVNILKLS